MDVACDFKPHCITQMEKVNNDKVNAAVDETYCNKTKQKERHN